MARKILLADDSVTAQNMGRKILADAGYDVVTVNNGSAALKRITEIKPDLIVLDVYMPGYSGLEVCQRLKDAAETAHIPILLTVGKLEPFKPEEARRVRADAHIVKPFEASELLTALTRLEDRMVPQPEGNTDADTGWKSRLRFPSKKKKEEPEPEPQEVAAGATFRDFPDRQSKAGASEAFTVKAPLAEPEPELVPDIPRDITPEELDALSALAAKLDGPIPAVENIAPLTEEMGPGEAPAELAAAKIEVEVPALTAEAKKEVEASAPVVEPAVDAPAGVVEVKSVEAKSVEAKSEVEIPVESVKVAAEAVSTAHLSQETAPVDRKVDGTVDGNDEPLSALAASAAEQAADAEEAAPSDAELVEALRLLTPATGYADVSTVPSHGTLVAAGQLLAEEAARNAATAPRWVAEAVTLSPEEAAISLEAEMFRTFAATPAATPAAAPAATSAPTSGGKIEPVRITGVSAIAAAVENRLAEAEMAASAKALPARGAGRSSSEHGSDEHGSDEHGSENTAPETSELETPTDVLAPVANASSPLVDGVALDRIALEKIEAEKDSPAKVAEEAPAEEEEVAAATFADAVNRDEVGTAVAAAATAEENQDSSSDSGGREPMGKDVNGSSGSGRGRSVRVCNRRQHDCPHRGQRNGRSSPEDRGRDREEAGGKVGSFQPSAFSHHLSSFFLHQLSARALPFGGLDITHIGIVWGGVFP